MILLRVPLSDIYLIQGVFFQFEEASIFAGKIERDPRDDLGRYQGELRDRYGISILKEVEISDSIFTFTKQYRERAYGIAYHFTRNETTESEWVGTYESEPTGKGTCRCILTPVSHEFFEHPTLEEV